MIGEGGGSRSNADTAGDIGCQVLCIGITEDTTDGTVGVLFRDGPDAEASCGTGVGGDGGA